MPPLEIGEICGLFLHREEGGGDTGHMGVSNVAVLQKDLAK